MYEAYLNKKDLYAMIAMSAFNNRYEDNLEFYPEGTELEVDGKIVYSGTGVTREEILSNNSITVKHYEILPTLAGDKVADDITLADLICSSEGNLKLQDIVKNKDKIQFIFES